MHQLVSGVFGATRVRVPPVVARRPGKRAAEGVEEIEECPRQHHDVEDV